MKNRRVFFNFKIAGRFKFVKLILTVLIILSLTNAYTSIKLLEEGVLLYGGSVNYFISQFVFTTLGLIFIFTLGYILYYGFGAIARMEKMLDEVAEGNYSLRMKLRKKDFMFPLAEKINKIINKFQKEIADKKV